MVLYNNSDNAYIETVYTYDEWEKVYKRNKEKEIKNMLKNAEQKILGFSLFFIGIVGCFIFPEDAGGFVMAMCLGVARMIL